MLNRSAIFFILAVVSLGFSIKSLKFVNVTGIIQEYYKFLKKSRIIGLFILFPLLLGASIGFMRPLNEGLINNLMIIVPLLMSIFFSYFAYYSDYNYSQIFDQKEYSVKKKNTEQCQTIINYNILMSIIVLILCLFNTSKLHIVHQLISIVVYTLFIQVLLNLLIIIKRNFLLK